MDEPHGGGGLVDVLAAGAAGAEDLHFHLLGADLDLIVVLDLRHDLQSGEAGRCTNGEDPPGRGCQNPKADGVAGKGADFTDGKTDAPGGCGAEGAGSVYVLRRRSRRGSPKKFWKTAESLFYPIHATKERTTDSVSGISPMTW